MTVANPEGEILAQDKRVGVLHGGWSVRDVTPTIPVPLGGYADRDKPAAGIHDPLEVRALSLSVDSSRIVLVVCDALHVDEDLVADIRNNVSSCFSVPPAVWVAATHTHGGPDMGSIFGHDSSPQEWRCGLISAAVEASLVAIAGEQPVFLRWSCGEIKGVATNRDHPERSAGIVAQVLSIFREDTPEVPAAILASIPIHPTVLSAENLEITGDLPAASRRILGSRFCDPAPWIAIATGAAADISTRHCRRSQDFLELERLAGLVAAQCYDLVKQASLIEVRDVEPVLKCTTCRLPLRLKHIPPENDLTEIEESLRQRLATDEGQGRTLHTALQGIEVLRQMRDLEGRIVRECEVSALRAGNIALVAIPGELYSDLGLALQRSATAPIMVLGYTNGHVGYLPPKEAFAHPDYEVFASPYAPGTAEELIEALSSDLETLFRS